MNKKKLFIEFTCFADIPHIPEPKFEVMTAEIKESMSEPYEITVELTSPYYEIDPYLFLKKPARIRINFHNRQRFFNGYIGAFKQKNQIASSDGNILYRYQATLYPQFWFLKYNQDYRIFQNQRILEIAQQVLDEHGVQNVLFPSLLESNSLDKYNIMRSYCVQYGESSFNFISRLLEERGFYYYFEQNQLSSVMRLGFGGDDLTEVPLNTDIRIADTQSEGDEINKILTCELSSIMRPKQTAAIDYNFKTAALEMKKSVQSSGKGETFHEYPGNYRAPEEGEVNALLQAQRNSADQLILTGESCAPFFSPGYYFSLKNHPNPNINQQNFTLINVSHYIKNSRFAQEGEKLYRNTFQALPTSVAYRPPRKTPKPRITGTQTALVIGPPGEEVYTDNYGRVKVQFHWNHRGYISTDSGEVLGVPRGEMVTGLDDYDKDYYDNPPLTPYPSGEENDYPEEGSMQGIDEEGYDYGQ